jgi:hypothetical protein
MASHDWITYRQKVIPLPLLNISRMRKGAISRKISTQGETDSRHPFKSRCGRYLNSTYPIAAHSLPVFRQIYPMINRSATITAKRSARYSKEYLYRPQIAA